MIRKEPLVSGEIYHIYTRSIAEYVVFNNALEYERLIQLIRYYQSEKELRFATFIESDLAQKIGFEQALRTITKDQNQLVQIIAYCLMPTHPHLILKQLADTGISTFMRKVLEGYSTYFNNKHKRKGPLWESRFKSVLVNKDEQLLHLTRYSHLNPVTAHLVDRPEDWVFSSYREYLNKSGVKKICQYADVLEINPISYKKFVNDRISYQRELAKIKGLLLE